MNNQRIRLKKLSKTESEYKGCVIAKYENAKGFTRWSVEKDGEELLFDFTQQTSCISYIDNFVK